MVELLRQHRDLLASILYGMGGGLAVLLATELIRTGLEDLRTKSLRFKFGFVLVAGLLACAARQAKPNLDELACVAVGAFWPSSLVALRGGMGALAGSTAKGGDAPPPGPKGTSA